MIYGLNLKKGSPNVIIAYGDIDPVFGQDVNSNGIRHVSIKKVNLITASSMDKQACAKNNLVHDLAISNVSFHIILFKNGFKDD